MQPVILASQSPRRKQLLEWAEIPFTILVKETAETYPVDLDKEHIAIHIAVNKAEAVNNAITKNEFPEIENSMQHLPILAADTIVVLNDEIIGKPRDREDAIDILTRLSGKFHQVITGVALFSKGEFITFADVTEVQFHDITKDEIEFYVDKYKPYDKAGAYAIQEWIGVVGIHSIKGDFYNVMGLPISRVVKILNTLNE
ncbi:MAG: septum formation protein Maf [Chitinophagaceae bacterium]|nr:septum formation protein Maf [Chitinophagaceae bacterium]